MFKWIKKKDSNDTELVEKKNELTNNQKILIEQLTQIIDSMITQLDRHLDAKGTQNDGFFNSFRQKFNLFCQLEKSLNSNFPHAQIITYKSYKEKIRKSLLHTQFNLDLRSSLAKYNTLLKLTKKKNLLL